MKDTGPSGPAQITGLILAGGAGRRVGGRDKGLIEWQGEPLVAHVARRLKPQCSSLVVSCNRNLARYSEYGSVVRDHLSGYQGPLAGLHAAALHIPTPLTLVCPCDVPGIPRDLAAVLAPALRASGKDIAYARTADYDHYCCAMLRTECLGTLRQFLRDGGRAVRAWYEAMGGVAVEFRGAEDSFRNMNCPN